jgi:hypothetical protein
LGGIRTHDPSNQLAKTHASDRTAAVTGDVNAFKEFVSKIFFIWGLLNEMLEKQFPSVISLQHCDWFCNVSVLNEHLANMMPGVV